MVHTLTDFLCNHLEASNKLKGYLIIDIILRIDSGLILLTITAKRWKR